MSEQTQWIVVDSNVLPEVVAKVLEVKKLLAGRIERSSAAACKRVGISRSAYYKYRDCVFPYEEKLSQNILTVYVLLRDEAGVLSGVLTALYEMGTNILTVNQNIPVDGVAAVTITLRITDSASSLTDVAAPLEMLDGVVEVRLLSGG